MSLPLVPPVPPVSVERHARVRLITCAYRESVVRVMLRYHLDDPLVVCVDFPPSVSCNGSQVRWVFARELIGQGLRVATDWGEVCVRPGDTDRTVVEVYCPSGLVMVVFDAGVLRQFLTCTYAVVPAGAEDVVAAVERGLSQLFGNA